MRIERARIEHRDAWAAMRAGLWSEQTHAEHLAEVTAMVADPSGATAVFVALSPDGGCAGFVELSLRRDHVNGCDTSPVAFLEGLYVRPADRRAGVARLLVRTAEEWGQSLGCSEMGSDTDWENPEGQAFHAALGFEETERVVFFRKNL